MKSLVGLIENIYVLNNNKSVMLAAHSMGNLVLTRFLNLQSDQWKKTYVHQFISISSPWAGTSKSVRDLLSGDSIIGNTWYNRYFDVFDRKRVWELVKKFRIFSENS